MCVCVGGGGAVCVGECVREGAREGVCVRGCACVCVRVCEGVRVGGAYCMPMFAI